TPGSVVAGAEARRHANQHANTQRCVSGRLTGAHGVETLCAMTPDVGQVSSTWWQRFRRAYLRKRAWCDPYLEVLFFLRFHLLIAAAVSLAFFNEQAMEAMVAAAEDAAQDTRVRIILMGAAAAALLVMLLWYCARVLLYGLMPKVIDAASPQGWF